MNFQTLWDSRADKHDHNFTKVGPSIDRFGAERNTRKMWANIHSGWGPWRWASCKQGLAKSPDCPSCAADGVSFRENAGHVFWCPSDTRRKDARKTLWKDLKNGGFGNQLISLLKDQCSNHRPAFESWCVGSSELDEKAPLETPNTKIEALTSYLKNAVSWGYW